MSQAATSSSAPISEHALRIIAAGGGSAEDERPLLELFADWTGSKAKVLFLPIAQAGMGRPLDGCLAWGKAALEPVGINDITMWTDLSSENHSSLTDFASIFISGGNTFFLLDQLRKSGFDAALTQFAAQGGVIYGGSAGAILLGRDILTCAHLDENRVGLDDTRGLNLVSGFCVWCHYQPEDDKRIADYVSRHGWPVLALSERSGVSVDGVALTAQGYEPTPVFTADGKHIMNVGESIPPLKNI